MTIRQIERTKTFKRDYRKVLSTPRYRKIDVWLTEVLDYLCYDKPLPLRYHDHALTGNWGDFRDCHIKPDLILIYRKAGDNVLELVRLSSHSDLGW